VQVGQDVFVAFGAHVVLYSQDAEADRRFLAESLGMASVDAGHGWLIFALPPSEVAVHPAEAPGAELYLMCDDLAAEMAALAARGVSCSAVEEPRWGAITKIALPGGGTIGLYQPRHPLAIDRSD
jgi:catechol 2,3-dioxygenase-like lactoylglutathione lyase family enzyme